jgi:hypothetical protein
MRHPNKKNMANLYVVCNEWLVYNFPILKDIVTIGRSRITMLCSGKIPSHA